MPLQSEPWHRTYKITSAFFVEFFLPWHLYHKVQRFFIINVYSTTVMLYQLKLNSMKKMHVWLIGILLGSVLISCGRGEYSEGFAYEEGTAAAPTLAKVAERRSEDAEVVEVAEPIERKLIKQGSIAFEVENLEQTHQRVTAALANFGGYLASDETSKSVGRKTTTLVVRIPAENFDAFLAAATEGVTQFDHKQIGVRDVTEEFLDVEARLKTKKELETRYLQLLEKAKNVNEILNIERELGNIRSEIESAEGRLKYLSNQVAFSTLNIRFYVSIPEETNFGGKFAVGFRNGWNNLVWSLVFLVNVWPFVVLTIALILLIRFWRKKKRQVRK